MEEALPQKRTTPELNKEAMAIASGNGRCNPVGITGTKPGESGTLIFRMEEVGADTPISNRFGALAGTEGEEDCVANIEHEEDHAVSTAERNKLINDNKKMGSYGQVGAAVVPNHSLERGREAAAEESGEDVNGCVTTKAAISWKGRVRKRKTSEPSR